MITHFLWYKCLLLQQEYRNMELMSMQVKCIGKQLYNTHKKGLKE